MIFKCNLSMVPLAAGVYSPFREFFMSILSRSIALGLGLSAAALGFSQSAWAVPSFARQTGLACAACHTTYPELTSFGRLFKLNGYTLTGLQQVQSSGGQGLPELKINEIPPFSAMFQTSVSHLDKSLPTNAAYKNQNNTVEFPQQMSFFFAGEISPHMGSFLQFTYDNQAQGFSIDNTDIRYANQAMGGDLIYGLDMNNNPTVEDLWQDTPAWSFPFISSDQTPSPAATLIQSLGQEVAGVGAYGMWNNLLYADVTLFRSVPTNSPRPYQTGLDAPASSNSYGTINGVAPYWRLALQHNFGANYIEVGTYGMYATFNPGYSSNPNGLGTSPNYGYSGFNTYLDTALDAQYERNFGDNSLVLRGTYIHEKQTLDAAYSYNVSTTGTFGSANHSNTLNTFQVNGTYHFGDKKSLSLAYFNTSGSSDSLLYPSDANGASPGLGSASGSPDSTGYMFQATYLPWQNVQVGLQYTGYTKFNGASSNYNGAAPGQASRSASDNNTVFVYGWFMW